MINLREKEGEREALPQKRLGGSPTLGCRISSINCRLGFHLGALSGFFSARYTDRHWLAEQCGGVEHASTFLFPIRFK